MTVGGIARLTRATFCLRLAMSVVALAALAACEPSDQTATPNGSVSPSTSPTVHPRTDSMHMYAHPPIAPDVTTPAEYVSALRDRAAWADGLFLYYPASIDFGARPEIDALQAAYPAGVPLTISAKSASPAEVRAFRDQLTPAQAAVTLWERWQEPADNFTTPSARANFRSLVEQDIAILRPAGIRVGVHEQCWTIDPANKTSWAGADALRQLIPPDVDIITATCVDHAQRDSAPEQMGRFLDFVHSTYPGVDVGFTSLAWSVPLGTPADSPLRTARAKAVADTIAYAVAHGVRELGWFDHAAWNDYDYDVASDPQLEAVLAAFHDSYITD